MRHQIDWSVRGLSDQEAKRLSNETVPWISDAVKGAIEEGCREIPRLVVVHMTDELADYASVMVSAEGKRVWSL